MTYREAIEQIKRLLNEMEINLPAELVDAEGRTIAELRHDLAADAFNVVVVGEFSRGKSSFLNALLGQELLPVGVTPTTATINVLTYFEHPRMRVFRFDGTEENLREEPDCLQSFVAESEFNPDLVRYVEIGVPSPLLENGMVYVDTPGVNDLSEQRADITSQFLPRADALIILLDSTQAVTSSERDFLETAVLANRIGRLMFVLNFADKLDAEDREGLDDLVYGRLSKFLGSEKPPVFVVSAKAALAATIAGLADDPGMAAVREELRQLQSTGPHSIEKALAFVRRFELILERVDGSQERRITLARATVNELDSQMSALDAGLTVRGKRKEKIDVWVKDRGDEILLMARKSLAVFSEELRAEIDDMVADYKGPDFKSLVGRGVPGHVKRQCKAWVDSYSPAISSLLQQFTTKLTEGLANEFQIEVPLLARNNAIHQRFEVNFHLTAEDMTPARTKVGLAAASFAALAMVIGAPIFVPFVTLAAFPFAIEKFSEHQLSRAKANLGPQLQEALSQVIRNIDMAVLNAIKDEISFVGNEAQKRYDALLLNVADQVRIEINKRQGSQHLSERMMETFKADGQALERFQSSVGSLRCTLAEPRGVQA
jgi:GTPase SAR1 family protein